MKYAKKEGLVDQEAGKKEASPIVQDNGRSPMQNQPKINIDEDDDEEEAFRASGFSKMPNSTLDEAEEEKKDEVNIAPPVSARKKWARPAADNPPQKKQISILEDTPSDDAPKQFIPQ